MLVLPGGVCVGQASHAWISGQLARAWAWPLDRPEEMALAAEQHDVGMAEHDLAPLHDPATGLPVPFTALPREVHLALWGQAPRRLLSQSLYAALGVSLHGSGLYERRAAREPAVAGDPAVATFVAGERALQDRLGALVGAGEGERERLRAALALWDALSLSLLLGWELGDQPVPGPTGAPAVVRLRDGGDGTHVLDPWPLRGDALEVRCEGRRLAGPTPDAGALRDALDRAERVELRFALRRA